MWTAVLGSQTHVSARAVDDEAHLVSASYVGQRGDYLFSNGSVKSFSRSTTGVAAYYVGDGGIVFVVVSAKPWVQQELSCVLSLGVRLLACVRALAM
jgi:hypothetical protein